MDDTNDKNQSSGINSYQDILDKYAASVKSSSETKPDSDQENTDPQQFLKDINSTQLESPVRPSLDANIESDIPKPTIDPPISTDFVPPVPENPVSQINPPSTPVSEPEAPMDPPILPPTPESIPPMPSETLPPLTPPIIPSTPVSEPKMPVYETPKTTEEIKNEIDSILADTPAGSDTVPPVKTGSNAVMVFFVIALLIFLGVAGALAYMLFLSPKSNNSSNTTSVTPTSIPSGVTCSLNGFIYPQGTSFPSADGCNTCTCQSKDNIVCTEKNCASTTPTSTKSGTATKSASLTPTKAATSSSVKTTVTPTKIITPTKAVSST